MSKTFEGAIKMTATEPGKLPEHYEADLIVRNFDETVEKAARLYAFIASAKEAAEELSKAISQCGLELSKEMSLVSDDGRILDCPKHGITASHLEDSLHRNRNGGDMTLKELAQAVPDALSLFDGYKTKGFKNSDGNMG